MKSTAKNKNKQNETERNLACLPLRKGFNNLSPRSKSKIKTPLSKVNSLVRGGNKIKYV